MIQNYNKLLRNFYALAKCKGGALPLLKGKGGALLPFFNDIKTPKKYQKVYISIIKSKTDFLGHKII
jgi:hypothetical protein